MPSHRHTVAVNGTHVVAGIELGGTKGVAVVARGSTIVERTVVATTTDPSATLTALSDALTAWRGAGHDFAAIGIASFGPVGLDPARADFGHITTTPKPGWAHTDVVGHFAARFDVPIGFDTDVNGAALAEGWWGAARGCATHVYLTVGTGIGGGVVVAGRPLHGLVHPEVGHVLVRRRAGDDFAGVCPFHGDCIEGLASGPGIAARAGRPADQIAPDDPVWDDVAADLAQLTATLLVVLSPQRIVIGGGVANGRADLIDRVRSATAELVAGYVASLDVGELIVLPALGADAGPLGTAALAHLALAPS